ncbi:MAG: hypothetical protein HZA60_08850 [Deltaproteobacteria bacterium]|nr:hypothetical protein [Deltaproteobacteria bacterium]
MRERRDRAGVVVDRNLSTRQVGEMFEKFQEVDEKFPEAQRRYAAFVGELEEKFLARGAEVVR